MVINWVLQMEKLMEVMNCTDEQMVRYATFKLTAEAERWWMAKREHLKQRLGEGMPIYRCISQRFGLRTDAAGKVNRVHLDQGN